MRARQRALPKRRGSQDLPLTSTTVSRSQPHLLRRHRRFKRNTAVEYLKRALGAVSLVLFCFYLLETNTEDGVYQPSRHGHHPNQTKHDSSRSNNGPIAKIKNGIHRITGNSRKRQNRAQSRRVSDSGRLEIILRNPGSIELSKPTHMSVEVVSQSLSRDYGKLRISFLQDGQAERTIVHDRTSEMFTIRAGTGDDFFDFYYAFDDDEERNPYNTYRNESYIKTHQCRRTSWHRKIKQDCNTFHEFDLLSHVRALHGSYLG